MHASLSPSLLTQHTHKPLLPSPPDHLPLADDPPPASLAAAAVDLSSSRAPPSPHPSSSSLPSSPSPSNSPSPPSSSSPLQHHHRTAPTPGRRAGQVAPHPAPRTPQQRCDSSSVRTAACARHHGRRRPPQAGENHPRVAPSPGRTPWLPHMAATVFSDAHDRLFVHFARNSVDARAREVQNWRSVAAISCRFSGQSDRWIGDLFAPSQSRFVEPTSSARNFAVAAPFCAPSVLVHSWIPGIYIFVLVFLLCSRQVYFSRRKTLCYILWYCIEDLALAPEEAPAGNLA
ncbi:putative formin-like protein 18 isoform X2 [Iris pallida]|uniref:Formin-like protein 18 isoform X2 n=1 Tax=Iris pallida TaxID=29817 RepID=A0AAX6GWS7_IRIPA|nr:putative formin-like protein 18 isoform X2 [Iris pallida]